MASFKSDITIERDLLWWLHDEHKAVRIGDWKLVAAKDDPWELYNLKNDRAESIDLAKANPKKATELEAAWQKQLRSMAKLVSKTPNLSGPAPRR
jgi:arylsulfatase